MDEQLLKGERQKLFHINFYSTDSTSNEGAGPASVSMLHGVPQVKVSQQVMIHVT